MNDIASGAPLRAFIRGAWLVLTIQFFVALVVFAALSYGAVQLSNMLHQVRDVSAELQSKQGQVDALNTRIAAFEAAMPHIRDGIVAFQDGRRRAEGSPPDPKRALVSYEQAVASYDAALQIDPHNAYTLDLKSYALYQIGLISRDTDPNAARASIEGAANTMRQGLRLAPRSINGYIQLAIYLCQLDRFEDAVAVYDSAVEQLGAPNVQQEFSAREGEIVRRCQPLRERFGATPP